MASTSKPGIATANSGGSLTETGIEIRTSDGTADGLLYQPEGNSTWPGVFFFTDISGIRASQRAMAARICSEGYAVLMPNLYYRTDPRRHGPLRCANSANDGKKED